MQRMLGHTKKNIHYMCACINCDKSEFNDTISLSRQSIRVTSRFVFQFEHTNKSTNWKFDLDTSDDGKFKKKVPYVMNGKMKLPRTE